MTERIYPESLKLLGEHVRDTTTGITGLVSAVCYNICEDAQFRIKRFGVDGHGKPYDVVWAYAIDCETVTEEDARHG
jgi:hypothetical protein